MVNPRGQGWRLILREMIGMRVSFFHENVDLSADVPASLTPTIVGRSLLLSWTFTSVRQGYSRYSKARSPTLCQTSIFLPTVSRSIDVSVLGRHSDRRGQC